jgi:hypothetical protein
VLDYKGENDLINTLENNYQILERDQLTIDDIDINSIEQEYLNMLSDKVLTIRGSRIKRYDSVYKMRLESIKQLRRLRNLRDLGV